jgi:hypothetical protein
MLALWLWLFMGTQQCGGGLAVTRDRLSALNAPRQWIDQHAVAVTDGQRVCPPTGSQGTLHHSCHTQPWILCCMVITCSQVLPMAVLPACDSAINLRASWAASAHAWGATAHLRRLLT